MDSEKTEVGMKVCSKCGEEKALSNFRRKGANNERLRAACNKCDRDRSKRWRRKNKEHLDERRRRYYEKNKLRIRELNRKSRRENIVSYRAQEKRCAERNRKTIRARSRVYYREHREEICRQNRSSYEKNRTEMRAKHRSYREKTRERTLELQKKYYHANQEKILRQQKEKLYNDPAYPQKCLARRLRRYGLVVDDYFNLLTKQDNRCAICGAHISSDKCRSRSGRQLLCVDHCHETETVRGLLCNRCNRGLGFFDDSPDILRYATTYLESHGVTSRSAPPNP